MAATFTVPTQFTAIDRFSKPMQVMGAAVNSFAFRSQAALARVDRSFRAMMSPINSVRSALNSIGLYFGIWVLIRAAQAAVGVMMDFEQANVNISTVIEKHELPLMKDLSNQARTLAVNYGVAASKVSELQFELRKMGYEARTILNITPGIVSGAIGLRTTPEQMAETMGGVFKGFGMNVSDQETGARTAQDAVDKLVKVSHMTAATYESFATQLPIISSMAKGRLSYDKVLAMLGVTRDLQIQTATASTSIKNWLLDVIAKQGKTEDQAWEALKKLVETPDKLTKVIFEKHGKKTVVTMEALVKMHKEVEAITKKLQDPTTYRGYADKLARMQLLSTTGHLKLMKSAYQELILSIDEGEGPVANAIKNYSMIASAALLIAAGSEPAQSRLAQMDQSIIASANSALRWLRIIYQVVKWFVIFKVALIAAKIVLLGYNIVLGVSAALGWANIFALRGNIVALTAYRVVAGAATAAQWLLNAAMTANPIGAIIVAIVALIGYMALLINNWHEWGAALSMASGPLGLMLATVMSILEKWEKIQAVFSKEGLIAGIKAIGLALYDAILYPLQQTALWIAKMIPGGEIAKGSILFASAIQQFREDNNLTSESETQKVPRLDSLTTKTLMEMSSITEKKVTVDVNVPQGSRVTGSDDSVTISPRLSSSMGWHPDWNNF